MSFKLINYRNLTHDSYFKSALKYSRSNLFNHQGDLQWKIAKKNINPNNTLLGGFFMLGFLFFFGWDFSYQPWSLCTSTEYWIYWHILNTFITNAQNNYINEEDFQNSFFVYVNSAFYLIWCLFDIWFKLISNLCQRNIEWTGWTQQNDSTSAVIHGQAFYKVNLRFPG